MWFYAESVITSADSHLVVCFVCFSSGLWVICGLKQPAVYWEVTK